MTFTELGELLGSFFLVLIAIWGYTLLGSPLPLRRRILIAWWIMALMALALIAWLATR